MMTYTYTVPTQRILTTVVWSSSVQDWLAEGYWRELCRAEGLDLEQAHEVKVEPSDNGACISIIIP